MLQSGVPFPDFSLPNQDGKTVSLKDFAGKWLVVYVYPKDDTPGCTIQGKSFTATRSDFQAAGIEVVGVSQDDVASHKDFSTKYKLPFVILADVGGKTAEAYGVLTDYQAMQIASRQSFLVNPDGFIVKHYADVNPDEHTAQVLADLQALMAAQPPASG